MLKRLILILSISFLALPALAADYRWNVPLPRPAPEKVAALPQAVNPIPHVAQVNPDPFNTQRRAEAPATTTQTQAPGQVIAVPAPVVDTTPGILSWILGGIASLTGGAFGFNQIRQGMQKKQPDINELLLRLVESNVPGTLIRTAAAATPLGPIVSAVQPAAHEVLVNILRGKADPATAIPVATVPADPNDRLAKIEQTLTTVVETLINMKKQSQGAT